MVLSSALFGINHRVQAEDTVFSISRQYNVPVHFILRVNNMDDEMIRIGDTLFIPEHEPSHIIVKSGETISSLALLLDISEKEIKAANNLQDDNLQIGQILRIPAHLPKGSYRVLPGDSLLGIANRHKISVEKLKLYNSLESDIIHPGEILTVELSHSETHTVLPGESLWSIARHYSISVSKIKTWNTLDDDPILYPGQILNLLLVDSPPPAAVNRASVETIPLPKITLPSIGEYFYSAPKKKNQPTVTYWEEATASTGTDFRRAEKILGLFNTQVEALSPLSNTLAGWHVVLDPGHGGMDPGAIVSVSDGNGNPVVVTEDEYAYDVALRIYRLLRRHGASVSLTILAPDHHIRDGENAQQTFINRKSEVYADQSHNDHESWRPVGTLDGLVLRKEIAAKFIQKLPASVKSAGTLFISIHADNSPDLPPGTTILYDGMDEEERTRSKSLAQVMSGHLGSGAFIRHQQLNVLKENPADAAVLVEARNIHYPHNAWALRSAELREADARKITKGILAWAYQ